MGGKRKQAQRTKNNARPSSSGRSAELLGSSLSPFVGFSTVKDAGYSSVLTGFGTAAKTSDDTDMNIDTNFQLVLKKMNKKDSKTKLKALQEFTELVKTSEPEAVKAVLPFWPRLYCVLAVDVEHKVREATHNAHRAVVLKVKRNLAPYLKQLAGPWFTSQYDTYPPAATAATYSFQDAFPSNKMQEAITFCQEEILSYICDNITVQTPQTLTNAKTILPEEAEAKYERLLIASLHGYVLYLSKLSKEQLQSAEQLNMKIIANAKFWKLAKNKVSLIRAAWFDCITALSKNTPFLLTSELNRVISVVFSNLDETEPNVLSATWQAALFIISNIQDWWKNVNIDKVVLPKLWKMLKEGGQGNAASVFPNLLPLISHLPSSTDTHHFYGNFFQNLRTGMRKRQVIQSRSEFGAISTTFIECLRYVIMKHVSNVPFCESLIITNLVPTIEWCFIEENIPNKILFTEISTLLQYWERNKSTAEFSNYVYFLSCFWNNLKKIINKTLSSSEQNYEKDKMLCISNKQIELLLCLKRRDAHKQKKYAKVKFVTTEEKNETGDAVNEDTEIMDYTNIDSTELNDIAYSTCVVYLMFIKEKHRIELMASLCLLVQHFDHVNLFSYLNNHFNESDKNDKLINIHENMFLNLLKVDPTCSKFAVELLFVLYKYLTQDEKSQLLESLTMLKNEDCFCWCVAKALSHPYYNDLTIQNWLLTPAITKLLVKIASAMLTDEISPDKSLLLKQALNQTNNGDLYISEEACKEIVAILCNTLLTPSEYPNTIDLCGNFSAQLAATLYTEKTLFAYGDKLILALFSLSCNTKYDTDTLSKDTTWEVHTAWQDVVTLLVSENVLTEFEDLMLKFTKILHTEFMNDSSPDVMEHLTHVVVNLLKSVTQNENTAHVNYVLKLILTLPSDIREMKQHLSDICTSALLIRGYISWIPECPVPGNILDIDSNDLHILKYLSWCRFGINILSELFKKHVDEDCKETTDTQLCIGLTDDIYEFIIFALYSYSLAKIFTDNYRTAKLYSEIMEIFEDSIKRYNTFLKTLFPDDIMNKFGNNSLETLYIFYAGLFESNYKMKDIYSKLVKGIEFPLSYVQLTQVFAKHINFDHVFEIKNKVDKFIITRALINCDEIDVQIAEAMKGIMSTRETNLNSLLYDRDISDSNWTEIQTVIEIVRLLTSIINKKPANLLSQHWDFIIISLTSWSASAEKSKQKFCQIEVSQFICAICDLYTTFYEFIKNDHVINNLNQSCSNLVAEFCDLFAQDVHISLINIWTFIANNELELKNTSVTKLPTLDIIGKVMLHLEAKYIVKVGDLKLPKWQTIVQLCGKLLQSPFNIFQLWGYHGLNQILSELVELDMKSFSQRSLSYGLMCSQLGHVLTTMQDVVQTMLMDFKLGEDSCRVQPFTDSYTFTFGYLLLWDIFLTFCQCASATLRYQYSEWLRDKEYFKNLLNNIFKLMPTEVLHCTEGKKNGLAELFTIKPSLTLTYPPTSEHLEHTVCWLYGRTLITLPALVRHWWTDTEQKTAQIVELVTAAYVSPLVCTQELQDVADKDKNSNSNMKVKVHPSAREVVAVYTVDEARMELMITLPANYPLGAVQVSCSKQIGGTSLWRNWVMQLTIFLTHQNGRIWDGLSLWKSSLDKKFDGVEECYICFSVLHHTTCQLPKLTCQTCRKKFHSTCLYKWFSTSNKSTCPICRNLF